MNAPLERLSIAAATTGEAYLRLLADRGIDCLFANAGTDFAPLIEAFARCASQGIPVPRPITVPHENVAVCMAMGHWLLSRRMQAVMVHVNVGTANTICGLLNAARADIPILLTAGRTPLTETGMEGTRNLHIHWTQEMYDQAGMVREVVKWDYELRNATQLEIVVDRALSVARAAPQGPVYLTLPREVLATRLSEPLSFLPAGRRAAPQPPGPDPQALEQLASIFAAAESPMIITTSFGLDAGAVETLSAFAERYAVPVVQHVPRCMSLPSSHPMYAGHDPIPLMKEADLVIVIESIVPWIPSVGGPRAGARVVHIGTDPLFQGIPIRGFECDLGITSGGVSALKALDAALAPRMKKDDALVTRRRNRIAGMRAERDAKAAKALEEARTQTPIRTPWLTHCISQACGETGVVIREAPQFSFPHFAAEREHAYYSAGAASGLGWGLGAAIGAKLAAPEKDVILVTGDGSYMFGVPVAAHYTALEQDAPFLTIIVNNQRWNEVGSATRHLYPDGVAAKNQQHEALTYFDKRLQLAKVVEAAGGHGERVTDPAALPAALARALKITREQRRQVVLDVVCA
jgi:acetolactate synthase-1/2/3 large subunit